MHRGDEGFHLVAFGGGHAGGVFRAAGHDGFQARTRRGAQGHVHGGAVFGFVDRLTSEEAAAEILQPRSFGQGEQGVERRVVDRRLGVIQRQVLERHGMAFGAFRIGGEQRRDLVPVRPLSQLAKTGKSGLSVRKRSGLGHAPDYRPRRRGER